MAMWGANVSFGGETFYVPAMDAARWLEILLAKQIDYEALFPGLCGPAVQMDVNKMILDGDVTNEDLERAILDLVEEVSGRRWWTTFRLCISIRGAWDVLGGELARHGVTPFGVPLSYWLDGAYTTMIDLLLRGPEPKKAEEWTRALTVPPASEGRDVDLEANSLAFLAAMRGSR